MRHTGCKSGGEQGEEGEQSQEGMSSSQHGVDGAKWWIAGRRIANSRAGDDARAVDGLSPAGRVPCDGLAAVGNPARVELDNLSPPGPKNFQRDSPPQQQPTQRPLS